MDIITTSLEALIQRATNATNQGPDNAAIDAFCGLINKEPECAQIAAKFITAKVHSLQEWEALQALLVLETCMKRCGSVFHSEVGKFRFLNELIKLVSPKFMGAHTPELVRRRVLELMYTWTVQYPREVKIKEAYDMLKKQGVVKEEPSLLIQEKPYKEQPSILQDEEKSQLLQKLLQSKNPDDLQAANRLIKSMVKEDERRVEEKWRHAAELETAVNNCRLLREMLENWDPATGSKEDLDLIKELHSACLGLSPVLYRLAGSSSDPAFCQSVIAANEELGEVFTKYNNIMKGSSSNSCNDASSLLDLTPSVPKPTVDDAASRLADIGLELTEGAKSPATANGDSSSLSNQNNLLDDIFGSPPPIPSNVLVLPALVKSNTSSFSTEIENSKSKGLEDLDLLGKSLLQESLSSIARNTQKKPAKVTLNDMSLLTIESKTNNISISSGSSDLLIENDLLDASPQPLLLDDAPPLVSKDDSKKPDTSVASDSVPNDRLKADTEVQVLPLGDINVTLYNVKPSAIPPFTALEERNGVSVAIFLAKNRPRDDVSIYVVTTSSKNESPLTNYLFQPVVPKCCRLRLLQPSSTTLPAHNPFLPPSAITQIMLIASPNKIPISLKFVISYIMDEETCTELGEINDLPLIEK
ncbi:ADP-ribosylation factor-binding protein GGA1 [Halyomorpha halys]|uniref:ADP-ribosylation factor-binding protein GGA1 n=1 Tax=Halyomorpha halys TaxID=286706 RepID=UPI0006D4D7F3|nr:ADP-ribosylation factor-binding protein GGA3 [Halyomorpha halys]